MTESLDLNLFDLPVEIWRGFERDIVFYFGDQDAPASTWTLTVPHAFGGAPFSVEGVPGTADADEVEPFPGLDAGPKITFTVPAEDVWNLRRQVYIVTDGDGPLGGGVFIEAKRQHQPGSTVAQVFVGHPTPAEVTVVVQESSGGGGGLTEQQVQALIDDLAAADLSADPDYAPMLAADTVVAFWEGTAASLPLGETQTEAVSALLPWTVSAAGVTAAEQIYNAGALGLLALITGSFTDAQVDDLEVATATALAAEATARSTGDRDARSFARQLAADTGRDSDITRTRLRLCGPWGGMGDEHAWSTDPPADFTTGLWVRWKGTIRGLEGNTPPGDPSQLVYGEIFTQTADGGVGIWDNVELAIEGRWDPVAQRWRYYLFVEWTEIGGTLEAHSLSTHGFYELPTDVPLDLAGRIDFADGRIQLLRKADYEPGDFTGYGARWATMIEAYVGPTSIATGVTEPWQIGRGSGYLDTDSVIVADLGGTVYANPTAEGLADDGMDDAGNEWTPGPEAVILTPTTAPTLDSLAGVTSTSFGRARLADANAAALRAVLGLTLTEGFVEGVTDEPRTSTQVLADDPAMTFAVASGSRYQFDMDLMVSGDQSADIRVALTFPTGTMDAQVVGLSPAASTLPANTQALGHVATSGTYVEAGIFATPSPLRITGSFIASASGNVTLQFCQRSLSATSTVRRGSSRLRWWRTT